MVAPPCIVSVHVDIIGTYCNSALIDVNQFHTFRTGPIVVCNNQQNMTLNPYVIVNVLSHYLPIHRSDNEFSAWHNYPDSVQQQHLPNS